MSCVAWSLLVLVALSVTAARSPGDDTLLVIMAVVPSVVTGIVGCGVLITGRMGKVAAVFGLVLSTVVACIAMVSFITPALLVVPVCGALLAGCVLRLQV